MSDLVAIAYPDLETAREVARNVGEAQKAHLIELDDMVIAEHRDNGKIKLHQPSMAGVGAAGGALWGGLIGLIFLAPLLGMAIGAASGAAAGAMTDAGVDDKFMKDLGAKLPVNGAALHRARAQDEPREDPGRGQGPGRGHPDVAAERHRAGAARRARRRGRRGLAASGGAALAAPPPGSAPGGARRAAWHLRSRSRPDA